MKFTVDVNVNDAFEESKHGRSPTGQFTSKSGAKLTYTIEKQPHKINGDDVHHVMVNGENKGTLRDTRGGFHTTWTSKGKPKGKYFGSAHAAAKHSLKVRDM